MKRPRNARHAAVLALARVAGDGRALDDALAGLDLQALSGTERSRCKAMAYGTVRHWLWLDFVARRLLARPLRRRDIDVRCLILLGLHELAFMRTPPHAAVAETVAVARLLHKDWARGLVNAVLRGFLRRRPELEAAARDDPEAATRHPRWLLRRLQAAWPQDWPALVAANNAAPPMVLRVNLARTTREAYLERLAQAGLDAAPSPHAPAAVRLARPRPVEDLPGFADGLVSVQDAAAQLAAPLLAPEPGQRVLDACAAPGGKTAHLLEYCPQARVTALDISPVRLARVEENLARLGLAAELVAGDATRPRDWWDGTPFERILLDAPCSATGVIRRHPDIRLLRRETDLPALAAAQAAMLDALWPLLAPGGILLYATCSVLPEENARQLAAFTARRPDARVLAPAETWGRAAGPGRQILTGEDDMDGFFYARLGKRPAA